MSLNWWQLPGARRFIEQISDDLRIGKNIALCLPVHAPRPLDLRQALFNFWRSAEELSITINIKDYTDWQNSPLKFLYNFFSIKAPGRGEMQNINALFESEAFTGKVIWIDGLTEESQTVWSEFLQKYEQKMRNHDSFFSRTVFVISFENELANTALENEICLQVRRWSGVIDSFDALLYAASIYRADSISLIHRQMAISTIANLALWDLSLADVLAGEQLKDLIEPHEMLCSIARDKGWEPAVSRKWHLGAVDEFDGAPCLHSAIFANSDCQTIKKRLWKAQVAVLFPYAEECRHDFLSVYSENLPVWLELYVPKNSQGEAITEIHELELSDLYYLFKQAGVNSNTRQDARYLRDIRNKLAHLQPLDGEDLLHLPVSTLSK